MSTPQQGTHSDVADYNADNLPEHGYGPGNSSGNVDYTGETNFPNGDNDGIDQWPVHDDGVDEKWFAKYIHNLYCAIIAVQKVIKTSLSLGYLRETKIYEFEYPDQINPNPADFDIAIPVSDRPNAIAGSFFVTVRGRELSSTEWEEKVVGSEVVGITIKLQNLMEYQDLVRIHYATTVSV